jgi:hypothetical protein
MPYLTQEQWEQLALVAAAWVVIVLTVRHCRW